MLKVLFFRLIPAFKDAPAYGDIVMHPEKKTLGIYDSFIETVEKDSRKKAVKMLPFGVSGEEPKIWDFVYNSREKITEQIITTESLSFVKEHNSLERIFYPVVAFPEHFTKELRVNIIEGKLKEGETFNFFSDGKDTAIVPPRKPSTVGDAIRKEIEKTEKELARLKGLLQTVDVSQLRFRECKDCKTMNSHYNVQGNTWVCAFC